MSDIDLNTTTLNIEPVTQGEPMPEPTPKPTQLKRKPVRKPVAKKAAMRKKQPEPVVLSAPKPLPANHTQAEFSQWMRDNKAWHAAVLASQPRRTKAPVISDSIKSTFFKNPTMSSEDVAKKVSAKLVTVKTFRGDAVNTFKNAMAAGLLSTAGKKWYEVNRRK